MAVRHALSSSATGAVGEVDNKAVWDQLRQCYDPEIPVDIVDLVPVQDENPAAIGGRLKSVFLDGDRAVGTEMTGEKLVVVTGDGGKSSIVTFLRRGFHPATRANFGA